jgi:hypothetical protein
MHIAPTTNVRIDELTAEARSTVNVRGTTRLTSAAIGEVLNRACDGGHLVDERKRDFATCGYGTSTASSGATTGGGC